MTDIVKVPNEDILRAGVEHAELHMGQWDQRSWVTLDGYGPDGEFCGTTACLAGHILLAQGLTWHALLDLDRTGSLVRASLMFLGFDANGYMVEGSDINKFRARVFGYTYDIKEKQSLRSSPGAMKLLKERITETTGIEF